MPRGGQRSGAGRKPKERAVVIGMDGARLSEGSLQAAGELPADAAAVSAELSIPPVDLSQDQQAFWRIYAPLAIERRTLVPATVLGFRELCEQFCLKQAIAASIAKLKQGPASKRAESRLRTYVKLAQRVDSTLQRFKLTSVGKADEAVGQRKATANPWAAVAGR